MQMRQIPASKADVDRRRQSLERQRRADREHPARRRIAVDVPAPEQLDLDLCSHVLATRPEVTKRLARTRVRMTAVTRRLKTPLDLTPVADRLVRAGRFRAPRRQLRDVLAARSLRRGPVTGHERFRSSAVKVADAATGVR